MCYGLSPESLVNSIMKLTWSYGNLNICALLYCLVESDASLLFRMIVIVFIITNSFYCVRATYTPFLYRHLFYSGLSKLPFFIGTYTVLLILSK